MKDSFIELARKTVETFVKTGKIISPSDNLPSEMYTRRAGVFVSIHKRLPRPSPPPRQLKRKIQLGRGAIFDGIEPPSPIEELRGCIGTYLPTCENIAQEIVKNAIDSATSDPRFPPITQEELPDLIYSIDILSKPELVMKNFISPTLTPIPISPKGASSAYSLNPKVHGLIVTTGDGRRGLLLPDLPGVETVEQQISICRQKAWIAEDEPITIFRFTIERHKKT
jgi:uncharacterized protein (TIGR00296 family)